MGINQENPIKNKVKKSKTGLGLYAWEDVSRGQFVIEYKGPILSDKEADKKLGKYLFSVGKNKTIDGSVRWNIARYINHSCSPNCEAEVDGDKIVIRAIRGIKKGEELTYNYGKEYFDEFIGGRCVCPKCQNLEKVGK